MRRNQGLREKNSRGSALKPGSPKRVKGGLRPFPSVPCRVKGQRPLWGLGQRPNCFSGAQFKETAHKGAGSEASLPVTSRFLRSAPKLLFRLLMLCRARWARPNGWSFKHSCFFLKAGNFASAEATKGHENRRISAVALWKPSGRTHVYWLLPGQNQTNQHISVLKQKPLEKGRDSSLPFQIP